MTLTAFDAIAAALNDAQVRFLVAGGLAVNAHGFVRTTYDVDLVIQLDPVNIARAFAALATLDYRPTVPVTGDQFADRTQRESWIRDKGMQVLNFHSPRFKPAPVDVFVTEPFEFDTEYESAMRGELLQGLWVRFVSLPTLIAMKRLANRPKDLEDIEQLRMLAQDEGNDAQNT
ncbi:MAG: hypothetical protein FJY56_09520 [Betaproteobacteria bacterium]|nr:hypothetical protein [Betaproteobacteria bacterium]